MNLHFAAIIISVVGLYCSSFHNLFLFTELRYLAELASELDFDTVRKSATESRKSRIFTQNVLSCYFEIVICQSNGCNRV